MKTTHTAAVVAVAVAFALTLYAAEKRADSTAAEALSQAVVNENFASEVLKVFSAKDGDAVFRAYLVKWKGQEVIASDPLAKSDYKVGEMITVLAMNLPSPKGHAGPRLLNFHVPPK